jgi:hypothetical protein
MSQCKAPVPLYSADDLSRSPWFKVYGGLPQTKTIYQSAS